MLRTPRITPQPANPNPDWGKPLARVLEKILKVLNIMCWGGIGIILLSLPWKDVWENNYLLYLHPQFRPLVANPFVKGAVLGLGIADILIGIHEIVHFKDVSKSFLSR